MKKNCFLINQYIKVSIWLKWDPRSDPCFFLLSLENQGAYWGSDFNQIEYMTNFLLPSFFSFKTRMVWQHWHEDPPHRQLPVTVLCTNFSRVSATPSSVPTVWGRPEDFKDKKIILFFINMNRYFILDIELNFIEKKLIFKSLF